MPEPLTLPVSTAALCRDGDLAEGQSLGLPAQQAFIVRHDGVLRAFRDSCPHQPGAPLAWRRDAYLSADGLHIVCHAHGARFDPATGVCTAGAALGLGLTPLALHIDTQGGVHLAEPPSSGD